MPNTTNTSPTDTKTSRPRGAGKTRTVRGRASYRTGSFEVFAYPHHSPPALVFGALWRWRIELFLLIVLLVAWVVLAYQLPGTWPTWSPPVVLATTITALAVVPLSRRFVSRRALCVYSRHRVRKCFVQSRVPEVARGSRRMISTETTAARFGLTLTRALAAQHAAAMRSVTLSMSRPDSPGRSHNHSRSPTGVGRRQITSPLLDGVHPAHFDTDAEIIPLPHRSTVTPPCAVKGATTPGDVPSVETVAATRGGATKRTSTRTAPPAEPTEASTADVLGWSGKDVSDYV